MAVQSPVIDLPKFTELLAALEGNDNEKRNQATALYQQAKKAEPTSLVVNLLAVVASDSIAETSRFQGAVLLRQLVKPSIGDGYAFAQVAAMVKQEFASELLRRFEAETNVSLQKKVGDIIAEVVEGAWDSDDQRGWLGGQAGWPAFLALIVRMANPASNPNADSCKTSIMLLKTLVQRLHSEIVSAQQQIGGIVQNALTHANQKIQCAAVVLVCEMVGVLRKKEWAPLMATAGAMLQVMQALAQSGLQEELDSCLQSFTIVAEVEPDFFKTLLTSSMQPGQLFSEIVKTREGVDKGTRMLSMEWLVTYAEKKPKWLAKNVPNFGQLVIECCMALMLEISDDASELKAWIERMDDEEGEEDADELYQVGEECIDRFVEAVGMDVAGKALFELVGRFVLQDAWQAKLAALAAVKQTVEYAEEPEHVSEMAKLLLLHADHPHPRVRYISLHALGQLAHDQAPSFQEGWHKTVMPVLLQKMDDPVDRVASMAMSSFVCFAEDLDKTILLGYSHGLMQKLVSKLQASSHRMVQEECVTSIAVIAGSLEEDFSQYYDDIMPLLKKFLMSSPADNQRRLRGKAFECMALLGLAVGKEKFLPDAQGAVAEMYKTSQAMEADDPQREYIHEASERICKCLKRDFAQFLPHLLPDILKSLNFSEQDISGSPSQDDDEDNHVTITMGDGKLVKVHSDKFEEIALSLKMLRSFCEEMDGAFFDYVPAVAASLLQLFSAKDEYSMLCDDARGGAFQTWAALIKCASLGAKERGQDNTLVNELLRSALRHIVTIVQEEGDAEARFMIASSLPECLRNAGPGLLSGGEVLQLVRQLFKFIDESFERTHAVDKDTKERRAGAPAELERDEDDESDNAGEEVQLRVSLQEGIGAAMETCASEFMQCLPECSTHLSQWLQLKTDGRSLAIFLASDMVKHLKERSQPLWPVFMPAVFQALTEKDVEVRIPASYLINLASPLPEFGEAAPQAFRTLAQIVSAPPPKKRDQRQKVAKENAVAALFMLARYQGAHCPPEIPAWQLVVSKLPLKEDDVEAKIVHAAVVDLVIEQHAGLIGNDFERLGKILSMLAEVYREEEVSTKEADEKILRVFQMLPQGKLVELAPNFTEKQQKKVEKMLASPPP